MAGFVSVHTGAGNCTDETKYQRVIKESCLRATNILKTGGSVLDACEAAIIRMENSGNTNAGFGSNLTWDGKVECEASIMDSSTLYYGACTNVSKIKNPIHLARIICDRQSKMLALERIPPMVLAGEGAISYAKELGITLIEPELLISGKAFRCHEHYINKTVNKKYLNSLDTVGAVCIDSQGNCAAGCSSGGIFLKLSGRVGQAATYGAGCWAQTSNIYSTATCTTGNGEYIMKTLLAREIANDLLFHECSTTSLYKTMNEKFLKSPFLPTEKELYAGALSIKFDLNSKDGELIWCHTTKSLCLGYMSTQQKNPKFVHSSLPTYSEPGKSVNVGGHHFTLVN